MPVTAVIVQARMTSSRLPGKVMLDLGGHTVLWHVLRRCAAIPGVDVVCCAVPDTATSAPIESEVATCGAIPVRGPEADVLERYRLAAEATGADVVMRVTSDCPVVDPELCGRVLAARAAAGAGYACNNMPRSWPHGLDCEAFTRAALEQAAALATDPYDREHVTPWLRRSPAVSRVNVAGPGGYLAARRMTLDFPEDYAFFVALFAALPRPDTAGIAEINALLDARPDILALNAARNVA